MKARINGCRLSSDQSCTCFARVRSAGSSDIRVKSLTYLDLPKYVTQDVRRCRLCKHSRRWCGEDNSDVTCGKLQTEGKSIFIQPDQPDKVE